MIHLYDKNDFVLFLKMVIFQFATLNKQRVTPDNVDTEICSLPLTFETQSKETRMIWHNHFGGLVWKPLRYVEDGAFEAFKFVIGICASTYRVVGGSSIYVLRPLYTDVYCEFN